MMQNTENSSGLRSPTKKNIVQLSSEDLVTFPSMEATERWNAEGHESNRRVDIF